MCPLSDLPPWYTIGTLGLGAAMGAALAALWHGLWPYAGRAVFEPNIFAFAALAAAVVFVGIRDTFHALTRRPMDPGLAAVELLVGAALTLLLTQRALPFVVGMALLIGIRGQAGILTRVIVDLYDSGNPDVARRVRQTFSRFALGYGALLTLFLLFSGLDHSASLLRWSTAPIVLGAGASALILISGAEYEVMRSRFRGGEVTADASFGAGWWGPVAGLVAALVLVSAVVPPLPSVLTLRQVGRVVLTVGEHTTNGGGAQNVPASKTAASSAPTNPILKRVPEPVRAHAGLAIFLLLAAAFVVTIAVRTVLYARRAGMDVVRLLLDYGGRGVDAGRGAVEFFVGFYRLLADGLAGDWSGMKRWLRRWWLWILEVLSGRAWRNIWRQLTIRSAAHRAGAEFAADMGPRTLAGAVWNLPPGDPRRRVRELYRQFMQEARDAGLARRPAQTPAAYRRAIEAVEPGTGDGLTELTSAYEWARFSPHPVTPEHVGQASRGWERVAGYFIRLRERHQKAAQTPGRAGDGQVREGKPEAGGAVQNVRRRR